MAVLIWTTDSEGNLANEVETDQEAVFTPEQYRPDAEKFDQLLDQVLDKAVELRASLSGASEVKEAFIRAWTFGRALQETGAHETRYMRNEKPYRISRALMSKCETTARSTGATEPAWRSLRPSSEREIAPRRRGGKLDYFELCRWLQEQEYEEALVTFGGSVRNAWQMFERPALRPLVFRNAFREWIEALPAELEVETVKPRVFAETMKRLRARWPDRGPGSAKRPIHYNKDDLVREIRIVLES